MNKPKLGQWVKARAVMQKGGNYRQTRWNRIEKAIEGVYIGKRFDSRPGFKEGLVTWLIIINENENPYHVLPDDVRFMPECQNCSGFINIELSENDFFKLEAYCDECDINYKPSDYLFEDDVAKYEALGIKVE